MADADELKRLGASVSVKLVDWQFAAMDYGEEGILKAPARAIPRPLARHGLRLDEIALLETMKPSPRRCWPT